MSETEIRKDIDALIGELKALKSELGIRYGFLKEDAVGLIKALVLIMASLVGLKLAIRIVKALLSFAFRHKLLLAVLSGLGYYGFKTMENKGGNAQI